MPRIARAVAASFPHHVVQRGNNKEAVFFDEEDRVKYIHLIGKYSDKWNSPVLAYCLMTNHVHLLVKPRENVSLYKMMQGVTLCYTQYVNRRYGRTGRLWESRYHLLAPPTSLLHRRQRLLPLGSGQIHRDKPCTSRYREEGRSL